jgi:hypothetical protein
MLVNLARDALRAASWPTCIRTGTLMFDLDDNVRNVKDLGDASPIEAAWRL